MSRIDAFDRVTIIKTTESDHLYDIITFDRHLQRKLLTLSRDYPKTCHKVYYNPDTGEAEYTVKKHDVILSIRSKEE